MTASGSADLNEIGDGAADSSFVLTAICSLYGITAEPLHMEVCKNNMFKFGTGYTISPEGKLRKPPNHPKPKIAELIAAQKHDWRVVLTADNVKRTVKNRLDMQAAALMCFRMAQEAAKNAPNNACVQTWGNRIVVLIGSVVIQSYHAEPDLPEEKIDGQDTTAEGSDQG